MYYVSKKGGGRGSAKCLLLLTWGEGGLRGHAYVIIFWIFFALDRKITKNLVKNPKQLFATIHKDRIFWKKPPWKQRNGFQKWDKKHKSRGLYWRAYCIRKLHRDCLRFLFLFLKSNWLLILWYSCDFCKLALAYFFVYFEALAFAIQSCKSMYD